MLSLSSKKSKVHECASVKTQNPINKKLGDINFFILIRRMSLWKSSLGTAFSKKILVGPNFVTCTLTLNTLLSFFSPFG
jgi:hypothetical protein